LTVSRFGNGLLPLLAAGLLAGSGIVVMHYSGMSAMHMPGVRISYNAWLVWASVAIAVIAATAAFWLAFRTEGTLERFAAAVVMGLAIAGMHYTAMGAAHFVMDGQSVEHGDVGIEQGMLAIAVVSASSILLLLGLVTAFFDRKLATLTANEALLLQRSEERLRALHSNSSDIVAILAGDGTITYECSSARHILGYDSQELIDRKLYDFVPLEQASVVQRFLRGLLHEPHATATIELRARHADRSWRDFEVIGKNLLGDPAICGLTINMRDISERKRLMAELERLSETDALTNTLNRRGFLKLAQREFERSRRLDQPFSIVMIDIDHFKQVNDSYGHAAGDLVLAMVADQCRESIRNIDILSRFGGEEFILLLTEATIAEAHQIVARIHQSIAAARVTTIKGEVGVTASFGIASVESHTPDLETVIRLADEALYDAKNSGRNCIKVRAA
jgi:diguanylate cyclase (GGDEF)-like protein/PAS domain S-box-containing protein